MNWTLSSAASKQHSTLYGLERALGTFPILSNRRYGIKHAHSPHDGRVIHIPRANVFRFGDTGASDATFKDLEWTVKVGESWAVVGATPSSKSELFQVCHSTILNTCHVLTLFYTTAFKASTWSTTSQALSSRRDISLLIPHHERCTRA
jgi:hypothetical protein